MSELADEQDSDSCGGYVVWVQVPFSAVKTPVILGFFVRFFKSNQKGNQNKLKERKNLNSILFS